MLDENISEILEMLDFINGHGGFAEYNDYSDLHDAVSLLPCNEWISVDDALPAFDQHVLAFVKNKDPEIRFNRDGIYIAELKDKIPKPDPEGKNNFWGIPGYDSEWAVLGWSYFSEPCVTHWMPLPEPPEVEE